MTKLLVCAALLLSACGTYEKSDTKAQPSQVEHVVADVEPVEPEQIIDATLKPFVDEFLLDCDKYGVLDVCSERLAMIKEITLAPIEHKPVAAGICQFSDGLPIRVGVDSNIPKTMWKAVLYHEFGHCVLIKGHIKPWDGVAPISERDTIMSSSISSGTLWYTGTAWTAAVKKLFTVGAEPLGFAETELTSPVNH